VLNPGDQLRFCADTLTPSPDDRWLPWFDR
jgi:hypothetical protein